MTEHPDADAVASLVREAKTALDAGRADPELRQALDQLIADRANGEPLGPAQERLTKALHQEETR